MRDSRLEDPGGVSGNSRQGSRVRHARRMVWRDSWRIGDFANGGRTHGHRVRNRRKITGAVLGMILACGVMATVAAPADGPVLSMTDAIVLAVRDNAELASLRARWEAMGQRPAEARALPNPMLKYGGMDPASGGNWPDTGEKRLMVEQEFSWPGKRRLREGMAIKDAEAMGREVETMTRDVVMMTKESFYRLGALQHAIDITKQEEQVLQRMAKIAESMFATGERTEQDVLKATSEITMVRQRLVDLDAQAAAAKAQLNTLINRRADAPLGPLELPPDSPMPIDTERLFGLAATNRPEIQAASIQAERFELEKQLMRKEGAPDYRLGIEYRDIADSDDMVMFTVGIDLPVWRTKYRAGVLEAEKMKASALAGREAAQRQSARDVQEALSRMTAARQSLDLYRRELIPQADARFKASEAGYQTGKVDFMDLLESERFSLSARVMAVMAEGDLGMEAARLERATSVGALPNMDAGEIDR